MELAKAIARDPKVVLVDEPFAGLTRAEVGMFSELIRSFRDEGRAVMLVDHNVKSVAALVDRVLAMYLGEEIVTGRAEDVMKNETVRRVYLGGAIETHARPETSFKDKVPLLQVENVSVYYGKAQALENVSIHVHEGEFVSIVGLNGAGKTTLFNTISGFLPYTGEIVRGGERLRGIGPAQDRAQRPRAMPGIARTVRRDDRARKPRSRRPASARRRAAQSSSPGCSNCSRSSRSARGRWRRRSPAASSRCWRSAAR